ncbi:MAG: sulfate reduction electron transfer complex DsrMKJOP subunit DsrM [Bryobacteraceae bacterium]|jgi:nitrate reductase gamma subunit
MTALYSLVAVLALAALGLSAGEIAGARVLFGVGVPYAAMAVFLAGVAYRVSRWARTPVPFRIPTTCGQQRSLSWIKAARLESPTTTLGVAGRMALEILLFRSLFRNSRAELREGPRLVYGEDKLLWLGALAFHWSFLVIFLRHLRFFLEPIPGFVLALQAVDGFFQVGTPELYATDVVILAALAYLLGRRVRNPRVRYVSLFTDYFALFLLIGLALSGVLMRYFTRVDLLAVKQLAMGLVTFSPVVPAGLGPLFFVHLTLLAALLAYFPFSKLMHMGGVFLSPTRNLANNNRMRRHVNPWNYPVKVHTYAEWEEEFREKIKAAGLPLEKE